MRSLAAWLCDRRSPGRPLRAAVSLLLAIVLVAGGASVPAAGGVAPVAGAALAAEVAVGHPRELLQAARSDSRASEASLIAEVRIGPRWRDLRARGLPAPRAPDCAGTPTTVA